MDLSKMLNDDEAGEKKHAERPRPERSYSEQPAHPHPNHHDYSARPGHQGATPDGSGYPARHRPLPPLHTSSYSPQGSHHEYPQSAHPLTSYPQGGYPAPHPKPSPPYVDGQHGFPRQLDYTPSPGSRNHSMASGGSPAVQPASPYSYAPSPAASYQQGMMTPGSRFSEKKAPSHTSTASPHGHAAYAQLDSPISVRAAPQSHPGHAAQPHPQQQHYHPHQSPHTQSLSRPPLLNRTSSGNTSQESQRINEPQRPPSGVLHQSPHAAPAPTPLQYSSYGAPSPSSYAQATHSGPSPHFARVSSSRERSISVSPKTILSTLPSNNTNLRDATPPRITSANSQMSPPSRLSLSTPPSQSTSLTTPVDQNKMALSTPPQMPAQPAGDTKRMSLTTPPQAGNLPSPNEPTKIPLSTPPAHSLPSKPPLAEVSTNAKRRLEDERSSESRQLEPPAKKRRNQQIPIWAQVSRTARPFLVKNNEDPNTGVTDSHRNTRANSVVSSSNETAAPANPPTLNGNIRPVAQPRSELNEGPLGKWEKSIINIEPHEEVTKAIGDFLFGIVVENEDLGTGAAGEAPSPNGQVEIEAKIGTLIDNRTRERISLPITTEAVLVQNADVSFESTMTEEQHKNFNAFLNVTTQNSQPKPKFPQDELPRIPIRYVHTREVDTFYDLPKDEIASLPPIVKGYLKPGQTPRLRVTLDKATGRMLAKIVKVRILDLHVYSPRTAFDWRVSVSVEMDWDGDVTQLTGEAKAAAKKQPDRNKDRLSYRHLAYQIDLTQVKVGKEGESVTHELEIEMASAAVREQGRLAKASPDNGYMDLVKGFADNVRVLVRQGGVSIE